MLVDPDDGDIIEAAGRSIRTRLPSVRTTSLAVFQATLNAVVMRDMNRW
ncbi:hypothetical protein HMPREF9621_01252 [Cutibacterium modestum HL037PA2]|nr:hypothetical protein HMPREF9621_01252 [Cutibacterium modestum HL037PA2]